MRARTGSPTTLFHCHQDQGGAPILELSAAAETGLFAANPRVINLYFAAQRLPSRIYHRPAELVKHHPRGLVAGKTELTLQEQGGHAPLVRSHQIRRPEPVCEWSLRAMKDRAGRQRNLVPTLGALLPSLLHQCIGSPVPASRADEAIGPPTSRQVLLAGLFGGKLGLKLAERFGERRSGHPFHTTYRGVLKQPDN